MGRDQLFVGAQQQLFGDGGARRRCLFHQAVGADLGLVQGLHAGQAFGGERLAPRGFGADDDQVALVRLSRRVEGRRSQYDLAGTAPGLGGRLASPAHEAGGYVVPASPVERHAWPL